MKQDAKEIARKLRGAVSVMNTPFTEENTIDLDSVRRYVDYAAENGASGILVTAVAGEVSKLTLEERLLIVQTAIEEAQDRLPVIGGASPGKDGELLDIVCAYNQLGCEAILVQPPYTTEREFIGLVERIAAHIDTLFILQDWAFSGYGLPLKVIVELHRRIANFAMIKVEVKPAGVKYTQILEATNGELLVAGGWASSQMIEALDRGVHCFMNSVFPDIYSAIYHLHQQGERSEVVKLFYRFLPIIAFSHQHPDISIHFNKRVNCRLGIFSTPAVRQPILEFDAYHQRITEELIDYGIGLSQEIKERGN